MKDHRSFLLAPSILSADFRNLEQQIRQTEAAGADWIHIDVMDGHFVPNITMGPFIVETCRKITNLPLDVHLMIDDPDRFIEAFISAGADILSVHLEKNPNIFETLHNIRSRGIKAGLVLNPSTPLSSVGEEINNIDLLLIMSVYPGFSGQRFLPESLLKIKQAYQARKSKSAVFHIQVDGGINNRNIGSVLSAGADVIVASSAIYNSQASICENIQSLRKFKWTLE